ncbi:MAG: hypothetical protein EXR77_18960, partial [Myxococcales bacterium]|nr:hypothetical protein [Myxococcales bacterium]
MPGQRHHRAWWRPTIAEFTASGMHRLDFAVRRGVHPESVRSWQRKVAAARVARPILLRVEMAEAEPVRAVAVLEVIAGPGAVRVAVGTDPGYVGAAIARDADAAAVVPRLPVPAAVR